MTLITLSIADRKQLRAQAHHLDPVVSIGQGGFSASVKREADAALNAHGLIKVRVYDDDRAAREALLLTLANELNAAPIQHIGKLLVLWRPVPEKIIEPDPKRKPGPRAVKVLKYSSRGGQRPEVQRLTVLGNQRLSAGGKIKRARPVKTSIKRTGGAR